MKLIDYIQFVDDSWKPFFKEELEQAYFLEMLSFIDSEYESKTVFPEKQLVFRVFEMPVSEIKCVILGMDPYPTAGNANGLAFSVNDGIKPPRSLLNIYKEINGDSDKDIPQHGNLASWVQQGVLLLNSGLTVIEGETGAHLKKKMWLLFTNRLLNWLAVNISETVFLNWGRFAINLIDSVPSLRDRNEFVSTSHPSSLSNNKSCGSHPAFSGSNCFIRANEILATFNRIPIKWIIK